MLVLAAFVIICAGVKLAAPILVPVVLGMYIGTVNVPLVLWLYRRRVPLAATVACALAADAVVLAGFSWLLIGAVARLSLLLPVYLAHLQDVAEQASGALRGAGVAFSLFDFIDTASLVSMIASLAGDVAGVVADLVLALIIAAFLMFRFASGGRDELGTSVLRTEQFRRAVREMYRYIAIKTLVSMATGASIGLWLWGIDADLPILFGILAFLLNYIPTLGSLAAGILGTLVGLLQYGPEHAALVASGYIVVNVIFGEIVEPKVMGRALGLWPLVVLLSVVFWGWLLGIIGAVLSALLTQALKLVLLSTPDLRAVGLALGPVPRGPARRETEADLLDEAMPHSSRHPPNL